MVEIRNRAEVFNIAESQIDISTDTNRNSTRVVFLLKTNIIIFVCLVFFLFLKFVQITGLRKMYFKSKWNLFDFIVLILCVIDIIVDLAWLQSSTGEKDENGCIIQSQSSSTTFSPSVLRLFKALKILRLLRTLRLGKVHMTFLLVA